MRRIMLLLLGGVCLLAFTSSAFARHWGVVRHHGWGGHHVRRYHVPRYYGRHYASRYYGHRHYAHRHYGYRPYVQRSYYPRYHYSHYVQRYAYPWINYARYYAPRYPVYYRSYSYAYPYCVSTSPSVTYSYAQSSPQRALPTVEVQAQPQAPQLDARPDIRWPQQLVSSEQSPSGAKIYTASFRRDLDLSQVTRTDPLSDPNALLAFGDRLFGDGSYQLALKQYDTASHVSPSSSATHFRRGFALIATRQYTEASAAFKLGLALNPAALSKFRLADLYGSAASDSTGHLESLAGLALKRGQEADLFFLIGVFLHVDGQTDRSAKFFQKAAELEGGVRPHLQPFLGQSADRLLAVRR